MTLTITNINQKISNNKKNQTTNYCHSLIGYDSYRNFLWQ